MAAVQKQERLSLGWIRSYEHTPWLHAHVALVAAALIDHRRSELLWMQVSGNCRRDAAKVELFIRGKYGMEYILKTLGRNEDIAFSANLPAFVPASEGQLFGRNAEERRLRRRIAEQAKPRECAGSQEVETLRAHPKIPPRFRSPLERPSTASIEELC